MKNDNADVKTTNKIRELRAKTGLSQNKFGKLYNIPTINISNWEQGVSSPPEYVVNMLKRLVEIDPDVPLVEVKLND